MCTGKAEASTSRVPSKSDLVRDYMYDPDQLYTQMFSRDYVQKDNFLLNLNKLRIQPQANTLSFLKIYEGMT